MDGTPTDHVLRPHHITLLIIISAAFKDLAIRRLPNPFALHIHRVLLNEVSEVSLPKPHMELLSEISAGPSVHSPESQAFIEEITSSPSTMDSADKMGDFIVGTMSLCSPEKSDEQPKLQRRSIFGFFCRRCQTTFSKLSASGLLTICRDYQAWCAGDDSAGYAVTRKDELSSEMLLFKTLADKKTFARTHYYDTWENSVATGDEKTAVENVRRFFEQYFHESNDSGYRHHALLHLVRFHYIKKEYPAARRLLTEAIDAARTSGDKIILHHCLSILHRLPPEPGQRPHLQEIQSDLHPLEILYDTYKLLDEEYEQPLSAAFHKIIESIGLYDHWLEMQIFSPIAEHQMAPHAVQSIVWCEAGCQKLCAIEEDVVLAFTDPAGDSPTRFCVVLNKAYSMAREGRYDEALAFLLLPSVWQGLSIHDYTSWCHQIWHILTLRTTRRGQFRLYREFFLPKRPKGSCNPKHYLFDVEDEKISSISESLYQLLQLRERDQITSGVDHLLRALWHSEFLCRMGLYRTAILLLADVSLQFGLSKKARRILAEIMPQMIEEPDLEQRAAACFTFARCIMAAGDSEADALREAISYLQMAEADFKFLEIYRSVKDVQYLLSIIYHNLGMIKERDEAAIRHSQTEEHQKRLELTTFDPLYQEVFEVVAEVGAALASRKY